MKGYTAMDYAIISSNYVIARYLKEKRNAKYQPAEFYEKRKLQGKVNFGYCNYEVFISCLD
jgi:hypothetical protein